MPRKSLVGTLLVRKLTCCTWLVYPGRALVNSGRFIAPERWLGRDRDEGAIRNRAWVLASTTTTYGDEGTDNALGHLPLSGNGGLLAACWRQVTRAWRARWRFVCSLQNAQLAHAMHVGLGSVDFSSDC